MLSGSTQCSNKSSDWSVAMYWMERLSDQVYWSFYTWKSRLNSFLQALKDRIRKLNDWWENQIHLFDFFKFWFNPWTVLILFQILGLWAHISCTIKAASLQLVCGVYKQEIHKLPASVSSGWWLVCGRKRGGGLPSCRQLGCVQQLSGLPGGR